MMHLYLFFSFLFTGSIAFETKVANFLTHRRSLSMVANPARPDLRRATAQTNISPNLDIIRNTQVLDGGKQVKIEFTDGSSYLFHSLWLRDACRDDQHVVAVAGERHLTATAAMLKDPDSILAHSVSLSAEGELRIEWGEKAEMVGGTENSISYSTFTSTFLRSYADAVAKSVTTGDCDVRGDKFDWLKPYTGFPDAKAPRKSDMRLWNNQDIQEGKFAFETFEYNSVFDRHLEALEALMRDGVMLIDGAPDCEDASLLLDFTYKFMGGLQKDPTRNEPNWKITKKAGATSISYAHDKRLINHTDQSVPPHGLPGLVLVMHYIQGSGANTLADGFAAAERLREQDPDAFRLLATYGYDAERDFQASRIDSTQTHDKGLLISRRHPIFELDNDGNLKRIVYNEVFRTPLTLPFDVFHAWYAAFNKWVQLIHSDEFETVVPMKAGRLLFMHNWRTLHGRAGGRASTDRTVVGGTVTREAFFSTATGLMGARDEVLGAQLLPTPII
mmetsp:Transcript_4627/g.7567  ORF Transcript_4627/g.7567 Transcript_4627/m.7567 type:complete len:503 (+) Transcript_4627:161-1669(+)